MGGEASLEKASPFFSIVVTTYDRAAIVKRCVDSCLNQTHGDFELIVVDDASSDETVSLLESIGDSRLRIVVHEENRGIDPSRHTGVGESRGSWVVTVDSDWELLPGALSRLAEAIAGLPEGVRILRGQLEWDDGSITPSSPPGGVVGYERHIRSLETDWGDALQCRHREVFERTPYSDSRRGVVEAAFELNLARAEKAVYLEEVLGKGYTDAENSWVRSVDAKEVIPRLLREAPDMLWMAETVLGQHGEALERWAPTAYAVFLRLASTQAFLTGDRRKGLRYGRAALRRRRLDPMAWGSIGLGLLGPQATVRGTLAHRRWMRFKAGRGPQAPGA